MMSREYLRKSSGPIPRHSREAIYQAFFFSVGAIGSRCCARPRRIIEALSAGGFKSSDVARLNERPVLVRFLQGGFDAIAATSGRAKSWIDRRVTRASRSECRPVSARRG